MKKLEILLGVMAVLWLSACEVVIDIESGESTERITINAFLSPDTTVTAYVTEASGLETFSNMALRSNYYTYDKVENRREVMYLDTTITPYILAEADVRIKVNGQQEYKMTYNPQYLTYDSDYVPQYGDEVQITASSMSNANKNGERVKLDKVKATATLPGQPKIEVLDKKVVYKEREYYNVGGVADVPAVDYWGEDSVMQITLRITDAVNERNFYRLAVRSVGASHAYSKENKMEYVCVDHFTSSDILFYDANLKKSYGTTPANFSNVFDDNMINGKKYVFVVESRKRRDSEITPYVIVELQQLSPDMYYYMKDIELFRISDFDLYVDPIQISSNVKGGWGVFGAMSYDRHIVEF